MHWKLRPNTVEDVIKLQKKYKISEYEALILVSRGIKTPDDIKFYLENDVSFLNNPFLFHDMEIFCDRLYAAKESNENVRIFGDRDADGITATVLMYKELKDMGINVSYTVPMGDEEYGITKEKIDLAVKDGITLAITVDCGVSAFEEIDYAGKIGLDFLVTDHHLNEGNLPPAIAIIDPKIEYSGYPFSGLAGCAVVLQCIWALRFFQTKFFNEHFLLLHSHTENNVCVIECAEVCNMMVYDRISEEVVPGVLSESKSKLIRFLDRTLPVLVLDAEDEKKELLRVFPNADISLSDIRSELEKNISSVKNKTLFDLRAISKFGLYSETMSELDTLIGLFYAYIRITEPKLYRDFKSLTALSAIGTISDLMPLSGENRIIVNSGLKEINKTTAIGLSTFLKLINLTEDITSRDISWEISPILNSSGRLGEPDIAIEMLLAEDELHAMEYASKLVQMNKHRKKLSDDIWERMLPSLKRSFESTGSKFVIVSNNYVVRGLTGILANRAVKFFKVPCVIIAQTDTGLAMGSIRSPENFNCYTFLSESIFSDLLDNFGGHAYAGGFSLKLENISEFIKRVTDYSDSLMLTEKESELLIDAFIPPHKMREDIFNLISFFEPYGEDNPYLSFLIKGARIKTITALSNKTNAGKNNLKILIEYGDSLWPCIFWNSGNRVGSDFDEGEIVDIVFNPTKKYYNSLLQFQLIVLDIKRSV